MEHCCLGISLLKKPIVDGFLSLAFERLATPGMPLQSKHKIYPLQK